MPKTTDFPFSMNNWYDLANKMNQDFTQNWQSHLKSTDSLKDAVEKAKNHFEETLKFSENQMRASLKGLPQNPFLHSYQEALTHYFSFLNEMYVGALDLFHQKLSNSKSLASTTGDPDPLNNMYEISRLWMECCENVYDKTISKTDYQKMYGQIFNSWGQWKSQTPH